MNVNEVMPHCKNPAIVRSMNEAQENYNNLHGLVPSESLKLVRNFLTSNEHNVEDSAWLAVKELLNWAEEIEKRVNKHE